MGNNPLSHRGQDYLQDLGQIKTFQSQHYMQQCDLPTPCQINSNKSVNSVATKRCYEVLSNNKWASPTKPFLHDSLCIQ